VVSVAKYMRETRNGEVAFCRMGLPYSTIGRGGKSMMTLVGMLNAIDHHKHAFRGIILKGIIKKYSAD
jgi:hypothetical protein